MDIIVYFFIFLSGIIVGFFISRVLGRRSKPAGTMYITQDSEKTLYSLELEDYPDSIAFQKEIVFKVVASKESLDRK